MNEFIHFLWQKFDPSKFQLSKLIGKNGYLFRSKSLSDFLRNPFAETDKELMTVYSFLERAQSAATSTGTQQPDSDSDSPPLPVKAKKAKTSHGAPKKTIKQNDTNSNKNGLSDEHPLQGLVDVDLGSPRHPDNKEAKHIENCLPIPLRLSNGLSCFHPDVAGVTSWFCYWKKAGCPILFHVDEGMSVNVCLQGCQTLRFVHISHWNKLKELPSLVSTLLIPFYFSADFLFFILYLLLITYSEVMLTC